MIRVAVVDDSAVMRTGLRALLESEDDFEIVGEAADGEAAIGLVADTAPDVTLLDVRMPKRDGLSVVSELVGVTKVLMLTFTDDTASIQRALADGACGYLVHGTFDGDSLGAMVRSVAQGVSTLSPPAVAALAMPAQAQGRAPAEHRETYGLSRRQIEVMDLIASGRSNADIASELFLAEKTVKNHINQIFARLGVITRAEAIVQWLDPAAPRS